MMMNFELEQYSSLLSVKKNIETLADFCTEALCYLCITESMNT
jgi:hypothetical protein